MKLTSLSQYMTQRTNGQSSDPDRRNCLKLVLAGGLSGCVQSRCGGPPTPEQELGRGNTSHVVLAGSGGLNSSEEDMLFWKQLGVQYLNTSRQGDLTVDNLRHNREFIESYGFKAAGIMNGSTHNAPEIVLNLPGRDEKIQEYVNFLRCAAEAGYHTTIHAHMANNVWSTGREPDRGGASARVFDLDAAKTMGAYSYISDSVYADRPTHNRPYTEQEIWDNWEYFIARAALVADEARIRIAVHPDDPPLPELGCIPRIFSSFDLYRKALDIAGSPNVGLCLCCGCWLEGGRLMGRDILETIRYFGERNRIFMVHFRNVDRPLPRFRETFLDNGYMDMYKIMKALVEVNNHCCMTDDHVPETVGGRWVGEAFSHGYMRALLERANEEVKPSDRLQWDGPFGT